MKGWNDAPRWAITRNHIEARPRSMASAHDAATVATPPPSESLPILMLRLREAMMRRLRPYLRVYDITEQQWRVLRVLDAAGVLDMQGVARDSCIQPPSVSRIMRKLVARELVQRLSAEVDQRRVRVRLAPGGQALLASLGPTLRRAYAEVLQMMGPEDVAQTGRLLTAMLDRLPQDADVMEEEEE